MGRTACIRPQAYTWHARVGTKRVLGGQFTYPNGSFSAQPHGSPAVPESGVLLAEFDQLFAARYAITLQLLPAQVQGGPYLSCLASIRITDTHNGRQGRTNLARHMGLSKAKRDRDMCVYQHLGLQQLTQSLSPLVAQGGLRVDALIVL